MAAIQPRTEDEEGEEEEQQPRKAIELTSLSLQQLSGVKKQLDEELEHLTSSFTKLRKAQARFRECLKSIEDGVEGALDALSYPTDTQILVPLTTSLYVPGKIADKEKVIVDVGTGYYVEKSTKDAKDFYIRKIDELGTNLKALETIVQRKANSLRAVEDVLRQKVAAVNSEVNTT